jgi:hypothetical protein
VWLPLDLHIDNHHFDFIKTMVFFNLLNTFLTYKKFSFHDFCDVAKVISIPKQISHQSTTHFVENCQNNNQNDGNVTT